MRASRRTYRVRKSKLMRTASSGVVAVGVAATLAACGSSSSSSSSSTPSGSGGSGATTSASSTASGSTKLANVTVSSTTAPSGNDIPLYVAQGEGIWKKYGLNVTINYVSTAVQFTSVIKGSDDVTVASYAGMSSTLQGAPLKAVAYLGPTVTELFGNSSIQGASSFKNKNVKLGASDPGSLSATLPQLWLQSQGVPRTDYTSVYFAGNYDAAIAAFENGSTQAILSGAPYTYKILSTGKAHVIARIDKTKYAPLTGLALSANTNWASSNSSTLEQFMKAWADAVQQLKTKRGQDIAIAALQKAADITHSVATDWVKGSISDLTIGPITASDYALIKQSLIATIPAIKNAPLDKVIDNSYVQAAVPSS